MPDNEEKIIFLITKPKEKCLGQIDKDYCKETCWVKGKCSLGISRAEAVERMAKAMAANDVGGYIILAEAALDALLGGKNA